MTSSNARFIGFFKGGKDHSEEREMGEEENDDSAAPREGGATRGRFRGRYNRGYRPRYFNRPRRTTEGEEGSGDKPLEGEADQVSVYVLV